MPRELICPQFVLNVVCAARDQYRTLRAINFYISLLLQIALQLCCRRCFFPPLEKFPTNTHRSRRPPSLPRRSCVIWFMSLQSTRPGIVLCSRQRQRHSKSNTKLERSLSLSRSTWNIYCTALVFCCPVRERQKFSNFLYLSAAFSWTFSCGGEREKRKGFNMHGKCCGCYTYTFLCCFTFELAWGMVCANLNTIVCESCERGRGNIFYAEMSHYQRKENVSFLQGCSKFHIRNMEKVHRVPCLLLIFSFFSLSAANCWRTLHLTHKEPFVGVKIFKL